jgi:DNA-binding transcriptional ArsR family regulator
MHSPEPRFSRIAAVIADPTRARMLAALLGGEYRSAGELASVAGITPQAASTQLAQLLDNGLIAMRQQGRHKYFSLADGDIARALEALSMVAERDNVSTPGTSLPTSRSNAPAAATATWRASWEWRSWRC